MTKSEKRTCPICNRLISVRRNRFGDLLYNHHKMATISQAKIPAEVSAEFDFQPGVNPDAAPIWEVDCPNSGQAVEDEKSTGY